MVKIVGIEAMIQWTAAKSAHCERWVAECSELEISVEGDTLDEVYSLIPEASHALLVDLLADDELDAFLKQRGWEATGIPTDQGGDDIEFSVPWNLVAQGAVGGPRRSAH